MWLTEVAAGSSNGSYVAEFASELMSTVDGLSNRAPASSGGFEFVSHVSWFSEYFFPAFNVTVSLVWLGTMRLRLQCV